MKYLRLALLLLPLVTFIAHAADDDDDAKPTKDDIPDFGNLDEYIYQPKSTAAIGMRFISGAKIGFSGNGYIPSPEAVPSLAPNVSRTYHDGTVEPDERTMSVTAGDGTTIQVPITPDGKTNTWSYTTNAQPTPAGTVASQISPDGYMLMNIYSAQTEDTGTHDTTGRGSTGVEVSTSRDMGQLGKHWSWSIFGGMTVNDLQSASFSPVKASVTTLTDTYDLFGETPPPGPYSAPSSVQQNITDSTGTIVTDSSGNAVTQTVDTTTLLGDAPINRSITSETDSVSVTDRWKLHGAYITFRGGPMLTYQMNDHLTLNFSVGPALIYSSSTYTVDEVLTPPTGSQIIDTFQDVEDAVVPAVYADLTLQYKITDRAGLYFGAFFQEAGSYTQTVTDKNNSYDAEDGYTNAQSSTPTGNYSTKIDFSNQNGLRTGMTVRF